MAKQKTSMTREIGRWTFIVGMVLAIIVSLFAAFGNATIPNWSIVLLAALGFVVGLLNIEVREMHMFLVASIAFLLSFGSLSSVLGAIPGIGQSISIFFGLLSVFVAPAAAVVAFVAVLALMRD